MLKDKKENFNFASSKLVVISYTLSDSVLNNRKHHYIQIGYLLNSSI